MTASACDVAPRVRTGLDVADAASEKMKTFGWNVAAGSAEARSTRPRGVSAFIRYQTASYVVPRTSTPSVRSTRPPAAMNSRRGVSRCLTPDIRANATTAVSRLHFPLRNSRMRKSPGRSPVEPMRCLTLTPRVLRRVYTNLLRTSRRSLLLATESPRGATSTRASLSPKPATGSAAPTSRPGGPPSNRATLSQPTSLADLPRLPAGSRRGWARRRRGSRDPPARPRTLAMYRAERARRPTS
jgi:hypothetical protein